MFGKVLGGYKFKSKKGTDLFNLTLLDDRDNSVGTCCSNYLATKLPCSLKDLVDKNIKADRDGSFLSEIEVK